jgi:hypothetical protein
MLSGFVELSGSWANSTQKNAREFFVLDLLHPPMGGCTQFLAN